MQKEFYKAAGFSAGMGVVAEGLAMVYSSVTGDLIDPKQAAEIVRQITDLAAGTAGLIGTGLSIYTGIRRLLAGRKLPWHKKDSQPPPKEGNDQ